MSSTCLPTGHTLRAMRSNLLLTLMLACLGGVLCLAQTPDELDSCLADALSERAMNLCASEELRRVEAELNEVYEELLLRSVQDENAAGKIQAEREAWVAYRNAHLEAAFPAEDKQTYGTLYLMDSILLKAELTRQQVMTLRALLVARYVAH